VPLLLYLFGPFSTATHLPVFFMAGTWIGRGKRSTMDAEAELDVEEQLPFVSDLQVHLLFLCVWVFWCR
jgi:hypothetical protein